MITITVSTNGEGIRQWGETEAPECHRAEDVEHVRYAGDEHARTVSVLRLTRWQAIRLMDDLQAQIRYDAAEEVVAKAMIG